ncbi:MAG: ABC transporter ATP-binding protein [Bacteroidota bacterium]
MSDNLLLLEKVVRAYTDDAPAVSEVTLNVTRGARLAIVGETGSGKSTLLRLAAGLIPIDSGKIFYRGQEMENPKDKLIPGQPGIAYLSQHFELPKFISVEQHLHDPYEMTIEDAEKIYSICDIAHLLTSDTRNLSGGEKQRVALAKLLMASPEILLLDEPFSNLDPIHKRAMKEVIDAMGEEMSQTIVLVSHDPTDVLPWADSIVVMKNGRIIQQDKPNVVYNVPVDEYVAGLFGKYNLIDPTSWGLKVNGGFVSEFGSIILRPEAFSISKGSKRGFNGEVLRTSYFGGYEEVEVMVKQETLIVHSKIAHFDKGDKVKISLNA